MIKHRYPVDSIDKALRFSCLLQHWKNVGLLSVLSVYLKSDGGIDLQIAPGEFAQYLYFKEFFKNEKYFVALLRKLEEEGDYECGNYQEGKNQVCNREAKGFVFPESRKGCPAFVASEEVEKSRRFLASPADVHNVEAYKMSIDYSSIEKDIAPLVRGLNSLDGICTMYSCQGHRWTYASVPHMTPFIRFYGNYSAVKYLATMVYGLTLRCEWTLHGRIYNNCPAVTPYVFWTLELKKKWYWRQSLRKDIQTITAAIAEKEACEK